jgi:DnaK suppressor protein
MDAIQLQEFKHTLEQLLAGLEDPFLGREEIAVENTPDAIDQVQNAADRALAIRQLELDFNRLRSLKGRTGTDRRWQLRDLPSCDTEISLKRLKAVPWAAFCIGCQEAADHERKRAATVRSSPASSGPANRQAKKITAAKFNASHPVAYHRAVSGNTVNSAHRHLSGVCSRSGDAKRADEAGGN